MEIVAVDTGRRLRSGFTAADLSETTDFSGVLVGISVGDGAFFTMIFGADFFTGILGAVWGAVLGDGILGIPGWIFGAGEGGVDAAVFVFGGGGVGGTVFLATVFWGTFGFADSAVLGTAVFAVFSPAAETVFFGSMGFSFREISAVMIMEEV
ncbi:MAG: hypothetical protein AB1656_26850 [Candidatus Omnitrophota bacterium]